MLELARQLFLKAAATSPQPDTPLATGAPAYSLICGHSEAWGVIAYRQSCPPPKMDVLRYPIGSHRLLLKKNLLSGYSNCTLVSQWSCPCASAPWPMALVTLLLVRLRLIRTSYDQHPPPSIDSTMYACSRGCMRMLEISSGVVRREKGNDGSSEKFAI